MKEEFREPYEKFLKAWGEDAQIMMAIEEMSELTKELCKYLRYKGFNNEKKINEIRKEKIDRTLKKV